MEFNELQHHGVKGMKWGVRRYQNKDGTLTAAGRKKLLDSARKYERKANTSVANNYIARSRKAKLTEKAKDARREVKRSDLTKARLKKEAANTVSNKPKSVKDMSTEELRSYVETREERLKLEKRYADLHPKQVSKGKRFAKYALEKVIIPGATQGANQYMTELTKTGLKSFEKKFKENKNN